MTKPLVRLQLPPMIDIYRICSDRKPFSTLWAVVIVFAVQSGIVSGALAHEASDNLEEFLSDPIANDGHRIAATVYPVDFGDERRLHYHMCFRPCTADEAADLPYDLQSYDFGDYEGFDGTQPVETTLEFYGTCFIDDDEWCEGRKPYRFADTRGETETYRLIWELRLHPLENDQRQITLVTYPYDIERNEPRTSGRRYLTCMQPCSQTNVNETPYVVYSAQDDGFDGFDGETPVEGEFEFDAMCYRESWWRCPHLRFFILREVE